MNNIARTPKQIGNLVKRQRKRLGLSQADLASRVGLRQPTVSLIETGNPAMRLDTFLLVMTALDLELQIAKRTKSSHADIEDLF